MLGVCFPLARSTGHRVIVKGVDGFSCTHYNLPTHSVVHRAGSLDMAGVSEQCAWGGEGRRGYVGLHNTFCTVPLSFVHCVHTYI